MFQIPYSEYAVHYDLCSLTGHTEYNIKLYAEIQNGSKRGIAVSKTFVTKQSGKHVRIVPNGRCLCVYLSTYENDIGFMIIWVTAYVWKHFMKIMIVSH